MKKIILFILLSIFSFSFSSLDEKIINEKIDTSISIQKSKNANTSINAFIADLFSSDVLLVEYSKINRILYKEIVLIFPDTTLLAQNINHLSKYSYQVIVYLFENEIDNKYLKNRSIESLEKENIIESIEKLKNVKILKIKNDKVNYDNILINSLSGKLVDSKEFNDIYYPLYLQNSKEKYLKYYLEN